MSQAKVCPKTVFGRESQGLSSSVCILEGGYQVHKEDIEIN